MAACYHWFSNGPQIYGVILAIGIIPEGQRDFVLYSNGALLSCIAVTTSIRSLFIKTISADSIATSVPVPM